MDETLTALGAYFHGDADDAWGAPNDAGFAFDTCGKSRREPVDLDGFGLVAFRCRSMTWAMSWALLVFRNHAIVFITT